MAPISFARGAPAPECLDPEPDRRLRPRRARARRHDDPLLRHGRRLRAAARAARRASRRRARPRLPDDRRAAGLRLLRRRAARAAAGPRPRRGADLRPAAEAPRLAGRRGRALADGRRGPRPRRARGRARARRRRLVPLHDPDLPEPERAHARRRAPPAARRDRRRARPRRPRGRPVRARPLRGQRRAVAPRARGWRARHLHLVVLEDGRARAPGRLLRRPRGARARPTTTGPSRRTSRRRCSRRRSSTSSSHAAASSRTSTASAGCSARGGTRCSARSSASLPAATLEPPEGGYFLWVDFDGASTRRRCSSARPRPGVTFVRGTDFFPGGRGRCERGAASRSASRRPSGSPRASRSWPALARRSEPSPPTPAARLRRRRARRRTGAADDADARGRSSQTTSDVRGREEDEADLLTARRSGARSTIA